MNRIILTFSLLWLFVMQVNRVWACPACNIHNYLAKSVKSSENIYVGKMIQQIDGFTVEVEVVRVIRGSNQLHSKVKATLSIALVRMTEGESYLFCDPKPLGLTYPVLPLEYEDEVLFLAQENPEIADLAEAIKRIQGISKDTKEAGLDYLERNPQGASEALMTAIGELRDSYLKGEIKNFGDYRLSNLLEALMKAPTKESREFLMQETDNLLNGESKAIDMASERSFVSDRGEYLQAILANIAKDEELQKKIRSSIVEKLPNLQSQNLVDAAYALAYSNSASLRKISSRIKNQEQRDAVALGLLSAGNRKACVWWFDDAFANWELARKIAEDSKIKQMIEKRIDDCKEDRPAPKASVLMEYSILFLPMLLFVFTRKARLSFLLSAVFGLLILWCVMLYVEVHAIDSELDIIFGLSMLLWGAIYVVICAIEILISRSILTFVRGYGSSAPGAELTR